MQFNARYYDAALGRFVSADTLIANFGNPQSLNRYSYGYNNPINNTDPTGHKVCDPDQGCDGPQSSPPKKGNTPTNGSGNKPADQATSADDTDGNDKGSGSPESPQPSREEQVQALIKAHKYDDAIALAVKLYGLKIRLPSRFPQFSSTLDAEGYTDMDGNIYIGIDAMSSPGWLASTIGHENVHVDQLVDGAWYMTEDGANLNEVEAYDWELRNAEANGLTQSERTALAQTRNGYLYSIQDPGLQLAAGMGNYRTFLLQSWWYLPQYTTK